MAPASLAALRPPAAFLAADCVRPVREGGLVCADWRRGGATRMARNAGCVRCVPEVEGRVGPITALPDRIWGGVAHAPEPAYADERSRIAQRSLHPSERRARAPIRPRRIGRPEANVRRWGVGNPDPAS